MNTILIEGLKQKIELTADFFYKQKSFGGYQVLISVIDDLMVLASELKAFSDHAEVILVYQELAEKLQEITEAMEQKDTILIADMLKYDIIELLDKVTKLEI